MAPGDFGRQSPERIKDIIESGRRIREYRDMNIFQKMVWYLKGNRIREQTITIGPFIIELD